MTTPLIVTGPGGGAYATSGGINAALAAARANGGTVLLARGEYVEDVALVPGDRLVAPDGGAVVRGAHTVTVDPADARVTFVRGVVFTPEPGQNVPTVQFSGGGAGGTKFKECVLIGSTAPAPAVDVIVGGDPPPVPPYRICFHDCGARGVSGGVALSLVSSGVVYELRRTIAGTDVESGVAINLNAAAASPFVLDRCELRGSLAIDESGMAAGEVAGRVRDTAFGATDPRGAVFATMGVGVVVELGGGRLDVGAEWSASGLVARAVDDVPVSAASRMGTAPGSGAESTPVARPRTARWYVPVGGTVALADFVELAVVDTTGAAGAVFARLPPLAEQFEGHEVELRNYAGTADVVATAAVGSGDLIDGAAGAAVHINAGESRRFHASRARGTWVALG